MPVTTTMTPVSSRVSRIAHWLGVSPSSCWPMGSAHCPVSRRRWSRIWQLSLTASVPHAGTRLLGLGAAGSLRYSTLPTSDLRPQPWHGSCPHPFKATEVVVEHAAAVELAEVEGRVEAGGLAVDVRVGEEFVVVAGHRGVQRRVVQPDLAA